MDSDNMTDEQKAKLKQLQGLAAAFGNKIPTEYTPNPAISGEPLSPQSSDDLAKSLAQLNAPKAAALQQLAQQPASPDSAIQQPSPTPKELSPEDTERMERTRMLLRGFKGLK